jgi:5'(3')-deoxyribonucleotidase
MTNPNMEKPAEPIALIDLDGTVADFDGAMKAELAAIRGPNEDAALDETDLYEGELPHMKMRRRLIKAKPGFWRNLKRLDAGFEILAMLDNLKFRCNILSKGPRRMPLAWQEKVEWCVAHVPHMPIVLSEDKGLVYGKVLVDDWPEYVERWISWRPRGLVLAVAQPWNKDIEKFSPNVIRYTGDLQQQSMIIERLKVIRADCED